MARVGRITRIVAVALLALAACGDDDAPDVDADADAELVEAALLAIDDVPAGFTEGEPEDEEDTANSVCNEEVLGLSEAEIDAAKTAEAGPVTFASEQVQLQAEITAFETDEVPSTIISAVRDAEYRDCVEEAIADQLPDGIVLGGVDAADALVETADGEEGGGLVASLDSAGTPLTTEVQAVRIGRFGVSLEVTSIAGSISPDVIAGLLETMVERLRAG